jgi:hypothetical protein
MKRLLFVPIGLCFAVACAEHSASGPVELTFTNLGVPGLVQRVRLSKGTVMPGEVLEIRSVITNRGSTPVPVQPTCLVKLYLQGVQFEGPPPPVCNLALPNMAIAPGDSIVTVMTTSAVLSGPGEYTLGVGQLSNPLYFAPVPLQIMGMGDGMMMM